MRFIKTVLVIAVLLACRAAFGQTTISALPPASSVNSTDLVIVDQLGNPNVTRSATVSQLGASFLVSPTITNPTITGGTISAPTITTPTITGGGSVAGTFTTSSLPSLIFGNNSDVSYPPQALITPQGPIAIRSGMFGCQDQGVGFSSIVDTSIGNGVANGNPTYGVGDHAQIVGGCQNGISSLEGYATFDAGAEYISSNSTTPPITLSNVTYDGTHVYPSSNLTGAQLAIINKWQYIVTNSVDGSNRLYGSYVVSAISSAITVVGWVALGSGTYTSNQVPSTTYLSGTPNSPTTYVGQPTSLFTRNSNCNMPTNPLIQSSACEEMDVINNSGATNYNLSGLRILALGNNIQGPAIYIAGQSGGTVNGFSPAIDVVNFSGQGISLTQTPSQGGVGLDITMDAGTPLNINNHSGVNVFTVDALGNLVIAQGLITKGYSTTGGGNYAIQSTVSGSVVFEVDNMGNSLTVGQSKALNFAFTIGSNSTATCNSAARGQLWYLTEAVGNRDVLEVCLQTATGYAWSTITSSP